MALAILALDELIDGSARFRVDTGTNRWFTIRIGRSSGERSGYPWVDDVVAETPLQANPNGGGMVASATAVTVPIPVERLGRGRAAAQLFTYRTRERVGPAFSDVVALTPALRTDLAVPESAQMEPSVTTQPFLAPRAVACRTHAQQMTTPALGDLLTEVIRIAGPIVTNLLRGSGGTPAPAPAAGAGTAAAAPANAALPSVLAGLLEGLLRQIPGLAPAVAPSHTQSLPGRFNNGHYARPFVFGIDDALLGAAIGQVVQILPQLANAAGQARLQMQADRNKLIGSIVGDVQQRMLMQQLLDAQRQAPSTQAPDLTQLIALLAQAGAAAPAPTGATAPVTTGATAPVTTGATGQSLSLDAQPSTRATVGFTTAPPLQYAGRDHVLFARGKPIRLSVQLVVGAPAPGTPLPKAIVRVVVKRADQSVVAEEVVKQRDLAAGATVPVTFSAEALAAVPAGEPVSLLADIRWRTAAGRTVQATGALEAVFVDAFFVKQRGAEAGPERELVDMDRYRVFWNKVWESPVLDAATGGPRKLLWGLDATLKYTVLVVGDQPSNGQMETRLLSGAGHGSEIRETIAGRMKSGIELSVEELNKLAPLWDGQAPLDDARLGALRSAPVTSAAGGEIVDTLKLEGKAATRGLVWAVPVLAPVSFTLGAVRDVDETGQVISIGEEQVRLPLPVAVRVLGLISSDRDGGGEAETEAENAYKFDGFEVIVSDKLKLTPARSTADG